MSPVFILSRLCLNRRFQFFGISVPPEVRYLTTFLTASSSITLRRPTLGVVGGDVHRHVVMQDLDREVFALLAQNVLLLALHDRACTVVRVHHLVADLV